MSRSRLNPFTRWFLLAIALFGISLAAYLGQAIAYNASHHHSLESAFAHEARTVFRKGLSAPLQIPAVSTMLSSSDALRTAHPSIAHNRFLSSKSGWILMLTRHYLWPLAQIASLK
jgi:hypothetical protein